MRKQKWVCGEGTDGRRGEGGGIEGASGKETQAAKFYLLLPPTAATADAA